MNTYMIIEKFYKDKVRALYDRFDQKGRMLPAGVKYINSWINERVDTCFQLMESPNEDLLHQWIENWKDFADFEIISVIDSKVAKEKVMKDSNFKPGSKLHFKMAEATECQEIADLLHSAFKSFQKKYTAQAFQDTIINSEIIKNRLIDGPTWVTIQRGEIVGTVSALSYKDDLYIRSMAVHPDARGQKIAIRLLELIESYAHQNSCQALRLSTTPFLKSAIHLYEKFGFRIINEGPYHLHGTPLFTMRKMIHKVD